MEDNWIRVEDKLPKLNERVLVYYKGNNYGDDGIKIAEFRENNFWYDPSQMRGLNVIAWKSLDAPKCIQ